MTYRKVDGEMVDMLTRALPRGSVQTYINTKEATVQHRTAAVYSAARSNNELAIERGIHISAKGRIIRATVGNKADIGSKGATYWPALPSS